MFSDVVPPTSTSAPVPANVSSADLGSQLAHRGHGLAREGLRRPAPQDGDLAVGGAPMSPSPKRGSLASRERRLSTAAVTPSGARRWRRRSRPDRRRLREVALERDEPLLGDEAVRERGHAARADVHARARAARARRAGRDREREAQGRAAEHARTIAPQKRPSAPADSSVAATNGIRSAFTRSPSSPRRREEA